MPDMLIEVLKALGITKEGDDLGTDQTFRFSVIDFNEGDYEATVQEHSSGDNRKYVVSVWELHD
jgi:hypothetical protein